MKILQIEIRNFKPFDLVSLPNNGDDSLVEGLFIIRGENSLGKTSLIEAILWGLFGENVMVKKDRGLIVKSGKNDCQVTITFELGGIVYRIIRKIERGITRDKDLKSYSDNLMTNQIKSNKNKIGNNIRSEYKSKAILFKKENDKFFQVCRGTNLVNNEVESLIGIDFDIIEKTIYIRQKEVDMLALADPGELRDLLKDLFNLNEFDENIKEYLKIESGNLTEQIKDLKVKLGNLLTERNELIQNTNFLSDKQKVLKIRQEEISQLRNELSLYPSSIALENIVKQVRDLDKIQMQSNINRQVYEKEKEHFETLEKRIVELKHKIEEINRKIIGLYELLQKDNTNINLIKTLRNEVVFIEKEVKNLRQVLRINKFDNFTKNKTGHSCDFWVLVEEFNLFVNKFFDDYVINEEIFIFVNSLKETIKKTKRNYIELLKKLEIQHRDLVDRLEEQKKLLSSNQLLGEIKQKSILYITDNDKCPVCNNFIKSKENLISEIKKEKTKILFDEKESIQTIKNISELHNTSSLILDSEKKVHHLLEFLEPQITNLLEKFLKIGHEANNIAIGEKKSFSLKPTFLDQLLSKKIQDETNLNSFQQLAENLSEELESILIKQKEMNLKLDDLNRVVEQTLLNLTSIETQINKECLKLNFRDLPSLLSGFNITSVEGLLSKINTLKIKIQERQQTVKNIEDDIEYIQNDILKRNQRIEDLVLSESTLKEKEERLRHIQFLIGEIDGFISSCIVEERLANILERSTNFYLTPFTNGRYKVNSIHSTMKKMKDRVSHGLVITLFDTVDMMEKTKDHISGGDETALGLALRIAISKLMGNIRPFKNIDKKIPMLNFIIMDEPLASIDSIRRNIIMKILTQDKTFKQIFFISHETSDDFKDFNSIDVNYELSKEGKERTVNYNTIH